MKRARIQTCFSTVLFSLLLLNFLAFAQAADKPTDPLATIHELEKVQKTNNELSVKHFTGEIAKNPKNAMAYAQRGKAYSGLKDYDKALADENMAISLDPKLAESYIRRAVIYLVKKDYDACWTDVHTAESLGGKFWPSFYDALKAGSKREK